MISFGSRDEVVFMLHVNLRDLGLICSSFPTGAGLLKNELKSVTDGGFQALTNGIMGRLIERSFCDVNGNLVGNHYGQHQMWNRIKKASTASSALMLLKIMSRLHI